MLSGKPIAERVRLAEQLRGMESLCRLPLAAISLQAAGVETKVACVLTGVGKASAGLATIWGPLSRALWHR